MSLTQCLSLVLFELGAGALLFTALLPTGEIRPSFFAFQSFLGAVAVALATVLHGSSTVELGFMVGIVISALLATQAFRNEKLTVGRALMALAGTMAAGLMLHSVPTPALPASSQAYYPLLFAIGGLLLVGATHTAMVLGHWYLLMRQLSFTHLVRFSWLALAAVIVRGGLLVATVFLLDQFDRDFGGALLGRALHVNGFFFGTRVLLGLVAPLAFGIMTVRCAYLRANQAATGLLYLSEAFVFFGELLAAYLLL